MKMIAMANAGVRKKLDTYFFLTERYCSSAMCEQFTDSSMVYILKWTKYLWHNIQRIFPAEWTSRVLLDHCVQEAHMKRMGFIRRRHLIKKTQEHPIYVTLCDKPLGFHPVKWVTLYGINRGLQTLMYSGLVIVYNHIHKGMVEHISARNPWPQVYK